MPRTDCSNDEFDSYSADYNGYVNRALAFTGVEVDFFTRVKMEYLLTFMAEHVASDTAAAALDVGCGIGNGHHILGGHLARLCGIDVSAASIEVAQRQNPWVEYSHFDGASIPYEDATFDFAFAICVFHHVGLDQRGHLVAEIQRVLKPGGFIVIFEHNPLNPLTMRVVNRCEFDRDAILLKSRTCTDLIRAGGFNDLNCRFILAVPPVNAPLRALDRLLSKMPLGAQYYVAGRK
jgi:SAM-dependent methyltransferase